MGDLRYCFEEEYVKKTLERTKKAGLAVIDSDGIDSAIIQAAVKRGVFIYDYLNIGALESGRSYYSKFKEIRIAKYDGWPGEYWVDVTDKAWQQHLIEEAKKKKKLGVIGLYFDNVDIYWKVINGFGNAAMRKAPSKDAVYKALLNVITTIVMDVGLIVMPNGGEDFVKRLFKEGYGQVLIKTVNQEGVLYEDFKAQPSSERKYRTSYLDWAKKQGLYIRGIEYVKSASGILKAKAYYKAHGWQGLYISKHTDLMGD